MSSANKIANCNERRQYIINIEYSLYKKTAKYNDIAHEYRNYCNWMCIKEDTLISLPNNKYKKVKDLKIGDIILSFNNYNNNISNIHKEYVSQNITIYGINDIEPFFTETHPIVSALDNNTVLSINPELTLIENPEREGTIKKIRSWRFSLY